jgi:hypothetical protein
MTRMELLLDISATASILYKFGFDELVDNQRAFVRVLNQLGFRTISDKKITLMNYRMMIKRLNKYDRNRVVDVLEMDIVHI